MGRPDLSQYDNGTQSRWTGVRPRLDAARALADHIAPRRVRRRKLESYESALRKHLIPGIGRQRMDRLRPEHLDQVYTALLDAGYSPASVLRHHRILSRALTVAVQRGHVPRNVAAVVDPPAQRASDIATALSPGEVRAVLEATATARNSAR